MIVSRSHTFVLAVAASAMIFAGNAFAAPVPSNNLLYDVTAGTTGGGFGNKGSWGFTFHIDAPITVSALGLWDDNSNGLNSSHQVGLWEYGAALEASATIDNLSTVVTSLNSANGRWLFTTLAAPVTLHAGTYTLGFYNPNGGDNFYNFSPANEIFQAGASYQFASARAASNSLVFPDSNSGAVGWVGPNLQTAAVPEVGSIVMGSIGAVSLLLVARFRQKTSITK